MPKRKIINSKNAKDFPCINSRKSGICLSAYAYRYLSNLRMDHQKAYERVMRYLKTTKDHMLTYNRSNYLQIIGYFDLYFIKYKNSLRSTSSYVYLQVSGVVSRRSVKQTLIASICHGCRIQPVMRHLIMGFGQGTLSLG